MINVLVVDDQILTHRLIETYLKSEQEIKIIGFANNGQEAIDKVSYLHPDVVLMDVEMPEMDGLTATKIIVQKYSNIRVLMLTVHDNEQHLSTALKNGAKGYLLKTTTAEELKHAISYAYRGYFQLSVELIEKYLQKIISYSPQSQEIPDLKKKINYLHKSLSKLESRLDRFQEINSGVNIERKIEDMLEKEITLLNTQDSHLQFKVDRLEYDRAKSQQKFSYIFKIIWCIIGVNILAMWHIFVTNPT